MGVFFTTSQTPVPAIRDTIEDALRYVAPNQANLRQEAADRTVSLAQTLTPKFQVGRFVAALLISIALLVTAILTEHAGMHDISKTLMTSFTGFSGIVIGLLGGEAQKSPAA